MYSRLNYSSLTLLYIIKGMNFLEPYLPIEVPSYSKMETSSCIDYYVEKQWLINKAGNDFLQNYHLSMKIHVYFTVMRFFSTNRGRATGNAQDDVRKSASIGTTLWRALILILVYWFVDFFRCLACYFERYKLFVGFSSVWWSKENIDVFLNLSMYKHVLQSGKLFFIFNFLSNRSKLWNHCKIEIKLTFSQSLCK